MKFVLFQLHYILSLGEYYSLFLGLVCITVHIVVKTRNTENWPICTSKRIHIDTTSSWVSHSGLKSVKSVIKWKPHPWTALCLLQRIESTFFEIFSNGPKVKWLAEWRIFFQKMLSLAFEVIVQTIVQTLLVIVF